MESGKNPPLVLGVNNLVRKPATSGVPTMTGHGQGHGYGELATEVQAGRQILRYTYNDFLHDVTLLAKIIKGEEAEDGEAFRPDLIIAIPRGGYPPAAYLGHALNLKSITDADVMLGETIPPKLWPRTLGKKYHYLLVDDMSDSGETLDTAKRALEKKFSGLGWNYEITTATLWVRENTELIPDYYARQVVGSTWIDFPWESDIRAMRMGYVIELMGFDRKFFDPPRYLAFHPMTDEEIEKGVIPTVDIVGEPERASVYEDVGEAHTLFEELSQRQGDHPELWGAGVPIVTTVAYNVDRHANYWRTFKV